MFSENNYPLLMKKIIILSKNHFPSQDASAIRFENMIPLLKSFGYEECLIFEYGYNPYLLNVEYENYKSISLRKQFGRKHSILAKIVSKIGFEKRYLKHLNSNINSGDLVLIGGNFSLKTIRSINLLAKKADATAILSMTEKYSKSEFFANGFFSFEYNINKNIYKKYTSNDPNVIAISSFMSETFKSKGANTCVIPFVFDSKSFYERISIQAESFNDKTYFIYCGKPTKKDLLKEMISAFLLLDEETLSSTRLSIVGVDDLWKKKNFKSNEIKRIDSFATFYGDKDRLFISSFFPKHHFSLLLRPYNKDYSKAGFPTKITESLLFGVPPITNLTSDLSLYLKDEYNSVICEGETKEAFGDAIKKAISLHNDKSRFDSMKLNASKTLKEKLDVFCFRDELSKVMPKNK